MDGITNSMGMNLSKFQKIIKDRGAWRATLHEVAKSWLNNNYDVVWLELRKEK